MAQPVPTPAFVFTFAGVLLICALFTFSATVVSWIVIDWDNSDDFGACDDWRFFLWAVCVPSADDIDDDDQYPSGCYSYGSGTVKDWLPWVYDERHSVWRTARWTASFALIALVIAFVMLILFGCKVIRNANTLKYALPPMLLLSAILSIATTALISGSDSADADKYEDKLPVYVTLCGGGSMSLSAAAVLSIISAVVVILVGGGLLSCWWVTKTSTDLCGCALFKAEEELLDAGTAEPQAYAAQGDPVVVYQQAPVPGGAAAAQGQDPMNPYVVNK